MSKLVFQFTKNEYRKTCNILKNYFTKSIFKNKKKKSFFLKLKQTGPKYHWVLMCENVINVPFLTTIEFLILQFGIYR
jgi:CTP:phosphocholine cytidylyltransferase-like protein